MSDDKITVAIYRSDDLKGILDLLNRELHADPITPDTFRRKVLLDPNFRPDGAAVARVGGRVIGFMLGIHRSHPLEDAPPDSDRGWITLMAVDKSRQRQGIGSRLLSHVIHYLAGQGVSSVWVSPYAPNYFLPGIDEAAYPGAIEFLKAHGFSVEYRPLSMESPLADLKTPDWVLDREEDLLREGVIFDAFKPEYTNALLCHLRIEFPGDWQRHLRESLARIDEGTFSPDQIFIAMERGKCIGFCHCDGERFGPFGVSRSERKRGIGAVLLFRCLHTMRSKCLPRAWFMWTDDHTANLYSQAGFHETRRYSVMRLDL